MAKRKAGRRPLPPSARRSEELRLYLTPGEMKLVRKHARMLSQDYRDWARRVLASVGA